MARETTFPRTDLLVRLLDPKPLTKSEGQRFIERGVPEEYIRKNLEMMR